MGRLSQETQMTSKLPKATKPASVVAKLTEAQRRSLELDRQLQDRSRLVTGMTVRERTHAALAVVTVDTRVKNPPISFLGYASAHEVLGGPALDKAVKAWRAGRINEIVCYSNGQRLYHPNCYAGIYQFLVVIRKKFNEFGELCA